MKPEIITIESIKLLFEDYQVYSIKELTTLLDCSAISVRKKLIKIGYYSSYTHNSKYYTLYDIPVFNEYGIWLYSSLDSGDIGFTKYKTINGLIKTITDSSEKGITEKELDELVKTRVANQLRDLCRQDKIKRVKVGRIYYYLSSDNQTYTKQYQHLTSSDVIKIIPESELPKINESMLIKVLLCVIKNFDISTNDILKEFKRNNVRISRRQVELIIAKYELHEKKRPLNY